MQTETVSRALKQMCTPSKCTSLMPVKLTPVPQSSDNIEKFRPAKTHSESFLRRRWDSGCGLWTIVSDGFNLASMNLKTGMAWGSQETSQNWEFYKERLFGHGYWHMKLTESKWIRSLPSFWGVILPNKPWALYPFRHFERSDVNIFTNSVDRKLYLTEV